MEVKTVRSVETVDGVSLADTRLGRHRIPSGAIVAYSPYLIHHRPDLYPCPDHFNPDR
ncbi:cytochrome P450 [Streptomyces sp. Pv4-95]|uniref:cytochrome P450 n=1 Tax=Streptomyces sp. Pv4-95 TaxID=3049543 RepID=UPI003891DA3A